uniref:Putative secreted protein n=1 Tax=Ixodes ricinus TaxID=34613 RepID=A0A147BT44_IXORI
MQRLARVGWKALSLQLTSLVFLVRCPASLPRVRFRIGCTLRHCALAFCFVESLCEAKVYQRKSFELTTVEEIAWLDVSVNDVERVHPPKCNEKLAHVLLHFRHAQLADVIRELLVGKVGHHNGNVPLVEKASFDIHDIAAASNVSKALELIGDS